MNTILKLHRSIVGEIVGYDSCLCFSLQVVQAGKTVLSCREMVDFPILHFPGNDESGDNKRLAVAPAISIIICSVEKR